MPLCVWVASRNQPNKRVNKDLFELPRRARIDPPGSRVTREGHGQPRIRPRVPAPVRRLHPRLIETWIDYKRTSEIAPIQLPPHPHEFELYYDI